jgi:hypothetical protein
LVVSFAAGGTVRSQSPQNVTIAASPHALEIAPDRGAAALWQSLQKLHTRASLIMFTAHPDDEDGGMLTYESRGQGVRAALLTLNRGEGGQNIMSDDYWDALGLVRTEELLAADSYYGVQQYWTRVADYGFSKTREEALKLWDHDRVLYDAVRVVRLTRPLVITSVFVGWHSDGHGHHMVAGQLAIPTSSPIRLKKVSVPGLPSRCTLAFRSALRMTRSSIMPMATPIRSSFATTSKDGRSPESWPQIW